MEIRVNTQIGKTGYQFVIDEKDEMDCLHKAAVMGNPPLTCSECKSDVVRLDSNKDKEGNTYVNIVCLKCYAKAKLGQYKTGGYFWHKFEKWIPKEQASTTTAAKIQWNE
jgi:hypothetical protein